MHTVCVQFNLLMGLRGLQPDALMIIFCEVVVMVWPQRQQLLGCLHMPLDQFGVCVLCSDGDNIPRTARIRTVFIRVGILMFIYTVANKMCAPQQGETE